MRYTIYTDGACRGNQFKENIGAWAYNILGYETDRAKPMKGVRNATSFGVVQNTTNNIMELTSVIKALERIQKCADTDDHIIVCSDSTYVVMGITVWYKGWIRKNWKDVKNPALWQRLIQLKTQFPNIEFRHVPGHAGNENNEYVDAICNQAMDTFENQLKNDKTKKGDKSHV